MDKSNQDNKKGTGRGKGLLVIIGIAVLLLSVAAVYLMKSSPVE